MRMRDNRPSNASVNYGGGDNGGFDRGLGGFSGSSRMSTLDYFVTRVRRHVRSSSSDTATSNSPHNVVEEEVEMRVSDDEGGIVECEDAIGTQPNHHAPSYNPEDFSHALGKYSRSNHSYVPETHKDKKARSREKEKGTSRESPPEMALRQFGSLPELLRKLKEDLKTSYLSFVKELVRDPHDGVTLLLDILKMVQLAQSDLNGNASSKEQQTALRRALIDEHECLSCLRYCLRCTDATLKLAHYPHGLYPLAMATMSNLARSRTLALQLLTRACEASSTGHHQVIDALSTLRLRFAEPVRCKFLVSMMLSHPQPSFQVWGLRFINALLNSCGALKERIHLQEELAEAGFDYAALRKVIDRGGGDPQIQSVAIGEISRWQSNYVDVAQFETTISVLQDTNTTLQIELQKLRGANMKLLEENVLLKTVGGEIEDRLSALQRRLENHGLPSAPSPVPSVSDSDISSLVTCRNTLRRNVSNSTTRSDVASTSPSRMIRPTSSMEEERAMSPEWSCGVLPNINGRSCRLLSASNIDNMNGNSSTQSEISSSESSTPIALTPEPGVSMQRLSTDSPTNNQHNNFPIREKIRSKIQELKEDIIKEHLDEARPLSNNSYNETRITHLSENKYNEHMPTTHIDMTYRNDKSKQEIIFEKKNSFDNQNPKDDENQVLSSTNKPIQQDNNSYADTNLSENKNIKNSKIGSTSNISDHNGKHKGKVSPVSSSATSQEPAAKRKAPRPPSVAKSPFSSSTSSLSSLSSAASLNGGERKDPEYENVTKVISERSRSRGTNEEGDFDYERDMVVYEAITVGNETIFVDNANNSDGSNKSKKSTDSKHSSDTNGDGPNVRQSVQHYENLVLSDRNDNYKESTDDIIKTNENKCDDTVNEFKRSKEEARQKYKNDDVTEREVEAVMTGLENMLKSAESSLSLLSQETVKEISSMGDAFEDRVSPNQDMSEEIKIVPTRVPQLPARSRSSRSTPSQNSGDPVIYLDYESPAETSDTETINRFNDRSSSPHTIETESTKSFGFVKPEPNIRRHETFTNKSHLFKEDKPRHIKRSESFQMSNRGDYNSHRSYSPRRRGSMDLLVPLEESEINISGRTFTRYTPQEVEHHNKVNELITAELSRRKNRSLEDKLDRWLDNPEDEWTLRWKYPDIKKAAEEAVAKHRAHRIENNKLQNRKDENKKNNQRISEKYNENKQPNKNNKKSKSSDIPIKPSRNVKSNKLSNKDMSAFNGFKNPSTQMYRESDYGPNFMLNKPGQRRNGEPSSDTSEHSTRDFGVNLRSHPTKDNRDKWAGRRKSDLDFEIPTPDYSATPVSTLSNIQNSSGSKHILDMPSGLY